MRRFLLAGAMGLLALFVWATLHAPEWPTEAESTRWLEGRAWISHMPRDKRDVVQVFVPMHVKKKRFGVAQSQSHYAFQGERFLHRIDGEEITLFFQQSRRKVSLRARTWACSEKGFELCLELSRGGEKVRFYSKKAWTYPREGEIDGLSLPAMPLAPDEAEIPADAVESAAPTEWLGL